MKEQESIPSHRVGRALALASAGVKIGANYAKYHTRKALTGEDRREALHQANAEESYGTFSRLKGAPLKVAQMLSIDQTLLPPAFAKEFSKAQYSAPPLSFPLVVRTFQREMGKHPDEVFDSISRKAVSGASIGQIHAAQKDSQEFAVKIQYPGVADSLKSDLRMVRPFAARMFNIRTEELDHFLGEVQERLLEETDYLLELRRGQEISDLCRFIPNTRFPTYHSELSTQRILTMDWMPGIPLDQFALSEQDPEIRNQVGQALWDFYHFQIHQLRIFHADPHPGNFLIENGILGVVDFGCVKQIPEDFYQRYFRLLDAGIVQDPSAFQQALEDLSLLLPGDSANDRNILKEVFRESVEILSRPFQNESFDFGNHTYLEEIRAFGDRTGKDQRFKKISQARGSPHALYINRAYFGLYNLLNQIGARIHTQRVHELAPTP